MKKDNFQKMLEQAISGNQNALENILNLYMPLIDKNSIINGILDEDCKQFILIQVYCAIQKFKP